MKTVEYYNQESSIEQTETEQAELKAENDRLLDELAGRLDALVADGLFTNKEAKFWLRCCENNLPEWTQEVIDSLPDHVSSGEEVMAEIDEILDAPVFTNADRAVWQPYAREATYQEKLTLVGRLKMIKKTREDKNKEVKQIQSTDADAITRQVRTAIVAGRLEEADKSLANLDLRRYEVSYRRLRNDLDKAQMERAQEQFAQALRMAA